MKKVLCVFGTRPEAIKFFPLILKLGDDPNFIVKTCVTAQHRQMLDQVLTLADITPDYDLDIMKPGQTLFEITRAVLEKLESVIDDARPDLILVQGDTTTAMVASLAAFYKKIKIGHLEAGLRSGNLSAPWPEEANRRIVSVMADLHFTPTKEASDNLLAENVDERKIFMTGNTVIDALMIISDKLLNTPSESLSFISDLPKLDKSRKLILVTGHRRENFDGGMERICVALKELAKRDDVQIIYPVHPNPNVLIAVTDMLRDIKNVTLIEPLDYLPFVYLMTKANIVLTDSGGVQEEAPALGKPVLVMRETTERPEGVTAGTAILVGTDVEKIVSETRSLLDDKNRYEKMSVAHNPYGDGKSSQRILEVIKNG